MSIDSIQLDLDFESKPIIESIQPKSFLQSSDKDKMFLYLNSLILKSAYLYNKLSSLSNSRTRLLPHQIESTFIVVNSYKPRFLLADEVGLGKTIEAALIMKELMFRKNYKKILIVTPSPLMIQWRTELITKFNESFEILNRKAFSNSEPLSWKISNKLITSIDFIKNPKYTEEILKVKWDLVIFDEAHRLRRDYNKITRSFVFAEKISKKTDALLLLSATPFRGKLEELFYLIHLIDPNLLGSYHSFVNEYVVGSRKDLKERLSKVVLRRRKIEIGGFTKRFAKTIKSDLSPIEREFYDETTEYVKREYNLAQGFKNRAVGFVMVVFQKLLDSSVFALLQALEKRKYILESSLNRFTKVIPKELDWDYEETENIEEFIEDLHTSNHKDLGDIRKELLTINRLIHLGKKIREDKKSIQLKDSILKLKREGHKKFLIFTQFRTTQSYLESYLSEFNVVIFNGSQTSEQKEKSIQKFKDSAEILICTEAGGEGRNLQFCNILFNYDLPWSPLKIEQRIGRIHRFGQKQDVYIFNLASKDTVAERILEVLSNKIKLFEESIGASDELLGTIEEDLDFNSSLMKFVTGSKSKSELNDELDQRIQSAKKGFEKLGDLVTPKFLDFNLKDYFEHSLEERTHTNQDLENFCISSMKLFSDTIQSKILKTKDKEIYEVFNQKTESGKKGTFNSEKALLNESMEFLAFGHPLVEEINTVVQNSKLNHHWLVLDQAQYQGIFYVFQITYEYNSIKKEIIMIERSNSEDLILHTSIPDYFKTFVDTSKLSNHQSIDLNSVSDCNPIIEHFITKRKEELTKESDPLLWKEENKINISYQKSIHHLESKLQVVEAKSKWEGKIDNKSSINRLKNDIIRLREEQDKEIRKVKREMNIQTQFELIQIYKFI